MVSVCFRIVGRARVEMRLQCRGLPFAWILRCDGLPDLVGCDWPTTDRRNVIFHGLRHCQHQLPLESEVHEPCGRRSIARRPRHVKSLLTFRWQDGAGLRNTTTALEMHDKESQRGNPDDALRKKSAEDAADFKNEIAGRETGRMRRFLSHDQTPGSQRVLDEERQQFVRQMSIALLARLQEFRTRLDELDRASIKALREAERRVDLTEEHLRRIRESATRDEYGRIVFRTKD